MDVSVIIVNYNTATLTKQCIDSIFKYTEGVTIEVLIIDNASSDDSKNVLKGDERVIFIENSKNVGFGQANNIGFQYAKGKYVFCLNSDTILTGNVIQSLFMFAESHKSFTIGVLGVILKDVYGNDNGPFSFFRRPLAIKDYSSRINDIYIETREKGFSKVDYISGADMFIPSSVINNIGGFDSDFFMYFEEIDLQLRMNEKGYNCYLINNEDIIHLDGGSFSGKKAKYERYKMRRESQLIYFSKHYQRSLLLNRVSVLMTIVNDLLHRRVELTARELVEVLILPFTYRIRRSY